MKSVTGFRRLAAVTLAFGLALSAATLTTRAGRNHHPQRLYDPTRELYREFDAAFEIPGKARLDRR